MAKANSKTAIAAQYDGIFTVDNFEKALTAAQANRQQNGSPARRGGVFAGSVDELEIQALPGLASNPQILQRMLTEEEITELGAIGGHYLSRMPNTVRASMLSERHRFSGERNGVIAVYYTGSDGQPCVEPVVVDSAEWARQWTSSEQWASSQLVQAFPWEPNDFYTSRGRRIGNGFTAVVDLTLTDMSGSTHALGRRRLFIQTRDYCALVAPTQVGSHAHEVVRNGFNGYRLPSTTNEFAIVAARVALARNPYTPFSLLAGFYLNLGVIMNQAAMETRVRRDILGDTSISEALKHLKFIRDENARLAALRKSQTANAIGSSDAAVAVAEGEAPDTEMLADMPDL